ncbi:MAG: DNA repair protein RadA [Acidobacteriota bacterium]
MSSNIYFECIECGYQSPKLFGKCPQCNNWNSMEQINPEKNNRKSTIKEIVKTPVSLKNIDLKELNRVKSGIDEFDRSLGGGIVPGSVILIGGEPGVGKSTLLLEVSGSLAKEEKILYFSGEESDMQIKSRAERLGINSDNILLLTMGDLEDLKKSIEEIEPAYLIIDSIQTINSNNLSGIIGSTSKLRQITSEITEIAKNNNITVFIIGHITKEGQIAGPKTLEHMVDVVLYFQGEIQSGIKVLRVEKNRFGPINELGIFQMTGKGLTSVKDPSEVFIQNWKSREPGTAIVASVKGIRPILIEIQALVTENPFGGNPRRMSIGFDPYRLSMLISVIEKKLRLPLYKSDIFLNVTGGINLKETDSDLTICSAILSNLKNIVLPDDLIVIGEVGLTGEIRPVNFIENRIKEAVRHGFTQFILPEFHSDVKIKNAQLIPVKNIRDFFTALKNISN